MLGVKTPPAIIVIFRPPTMVVLIRLNISNNESKLTTVPRSASPAKIDRLILIDVLLIESFVSRLILDRRMHEETSY